LLTETWFKTRGINLMTTMNKSILISAAIAVAAIFAGCDALDFSAPDKTYQGPEYVYFNDRSAQVSEGADQNGLTINLNRSNADQPLTVTLSVESKYVNTGEDASDQFSINPSNLEVTFDSGEYISQIQIIPVNNQVADGDKIVTVTMVSASLPNFNLGFAGPDNLNSLSDITIVDNDCPIDYEGWSGTFSVTEVFTAGQNQGLRLSVAFNERFQLDITQSQDDPSGFTYVINNSPGFDEYMPNGTEVFFNACGGTLNFDQPLRIAVFANMTIETATFDESNFSMVANGPLGGFGPYEFMLQKID
jgi:hypothetical protein